jgi:hypothetical protein
VVQKSGNTSNENAYEYVFAYEFAYSLIAFYGCQQIFLQADM